MLPSSMGYLQFYYNIISAISQPTPLNNTKNTDDQCFW